MYKGCDKKLDWKGRDGWVTIAEKEGDNDSDDKPIALELVCKLVAENAEKNKKSRLRKLQRVNCLFVSIGQ